MSEAKAQVDKQQRVAEAAQRALAEAQERRNQQAEAADSPKEIDGRDGLNPTRFGDWEKKGVAVDF
ncbi:MAG: DUF1674 domain-containing protein [Neomegalonema sp.]|nr:DUF1674 domain-containing protein [Neomegalonema sp.]